jgi:predicted TPR repeat methyltransferase
VRSAGVGSRKGLTPHASRLTKNGSLLVALLAAILYLPTLANELVWDDVLHIIANPQVHDLRRALGYFTRLEGIYYRPLIFLSFALEHHVWGTVAAGYHLTNLLLHAANTLLLMSVAARSGLPAPAAMLAGAIFAVHPLQTDAVAYVSGRTDLLMTTGALLAWRAVLARGPAMARGLLAAGSVLVSLLSKESGYAAAALVVWCALRHERNWAARLGLAGPSMVVAVALLALRPGALPLSPAGGIPLASLSAIGRALTTYIVLLVWPVSLQIDRLTPLTSSPLGDAAAVTVAFVAAAGAVWGLSRRGPGGDWTAWSLAFYLPVANVVPLYPAIADTWLFTPEHNLYAPLAGIAVLAAHGVNGVLVRGRSSWRWLAVTAWAMFLIAWGMRTVVRTFDWSDEARLFRRAAEGGAASPRVWYNHGNVLMRQGAVSEAAAAYRQAVQRAPHDVDAWTNLGVALQKQGQIDESIDAYRRAEALAPASALLLENLGTALLAKGDLAAARESFARAVALDPERQTARKALRAIGGELWAPPP